MNLSDYLKKNKLHIREFGRTYKISRDAIHSYLNGKRPARRQAWKIFQATNGEVTFQDLQYDKPPKRPLKDI